MVRSQAFQLAYPTSALPKLFFQMVWFVPKALTLVVPLVVLNSLNWYVSLLLSQRQPDKATLVI
jgi:hypothetical protein